MPTTRTHAFELPTAAESYLRGVYLSEEFARALHMEGLGFDAFELLEQTTSPRVTRRIRVRPRTNAPAAVRKVLGSSQEYEEEGELDGEDVWRYRVLPRTLGRKISIAGTQRVEALGDNRCRVSFEISFDVRILAVGGAIERFMADQFEHNLRLQEEFTRAWLARARA